VRLRLLLHAQVVQLRPRLSRASIGTMVSASVEPSVGFATASTTQSASLVPSALRAARPANTAILRPRFAPTPVLATSQHAPLLPATGGPTAAASRQSQLQQLPPLRPLLLPLRLLLLHLRKHASPLYLLVQWQPLARRMESLSFQISLCCLWVTCLRARLTRQLLLTQPSFSRLL